MMSTAKHIGRIGALAVALGVGFAVAPVSTASAASPRCMPTDGTCALVMGFTSLPTPDKAYIDAVGNQFIAPTHSSSQHIEYVPVTTPEEGWPLTGLIRLGCAAVGAQSLCGPGGAVTVAGDFVDAIGEGIDNAGALVGLPAPSNMTAASTNTDTDEAAKVAELQTNESISAVESVVNDRITVNSPGRTNDSTPFNAGHPRQTPLRDAVKTLSLNPWIGDVVASWG